jgi:3-hydroxyacyl-CoA dehydrogenase
MIRKVAVLGAGTMGAQIAGHVANAGLPVLLLDVSTEQVQAALKVLEKSSPAALFVPDKVRQIEIGSFEKDLGRINESDWVIEAIVENPDIKKQLLDKVDASRKAGSFVTTNTSGLSVTDLAQGRSEDFRRHWFGTHFFNPPRYEAAGVISPRTPIKALAIEIRGHRSAKGSYTRRTRRTSSPIGLVYSRH